MSSSNYKKRQREPSIYTVAWPNYKKKQLDPSIYTVAWIAPLEIETQAAMYMLDDTHLGKFPDDGGDYTYIAGEMRGHNVIIATFPAGHNYGTSAAAALASHIKTAFRNIRVSLLVGVAAGIPRLSGPDLRDIRLGDVLVAMPEGDDAAVVAYGLGKATAAGFQQLQRGHAMNRTAAKVAAAIGVIKRDAPRDADRFLPFYDRMKHRAHAKGTFEDPGQDQDRLYDAGGGDELVARVPRSGGDRRTRVWYGPIGSGDKLTKNAQVRDELLASHNVLGLEMEAAGALTALPVGVVRGVADYADPHKNKQWQPYAAAMAAAYAKAILEEIAPPRLEAPQRTALDRAPSRGEESADVEDGRDVVGTGDKGPSLPVVGSGGNFGAVFGQVRDSPITLNINQTDVSPPPTKNAHLKVCKKFFFAAESDKFFYNLEPFPSADWLFRQEAFQKWQSLGVTEAKQAAPALLAIEGQPFTGKSTLMKMAIDRSLGETNVITLYHFFGHAAKDDLASLFRDLLGQLLHQIPNKPWERIARWSENIQADRLGEISSHVSLRKAFRELILSVKTSLNAEKIAIRIFLDGMDKSAVKSLAPGECNETKINELLEFFGTLLSSALNLGVDIGICISGQQFAVGTLITTIDLKPYLNEAVGEMIRDKVKGLNDPRKQFELLSELAEHGAHNFDWANAVGGEIQSGLAATNFEDLKAIAANIAESHEKLYRHAIRSSKLSPTHESQSRVFLIALGACRKLTPDEFRHAYAFSGKTKFEYKSMADWEKSDHGLSAENFENFLNVTTGRLLVVLTWTERSPFAMTEEEAAKSEKIRHQIAFIHASTDKWLRSDKGLRELQVESLSQLERDSHLLLFRICGTVLKKCSMKGKDDVELLNYACEYWLRHARMYGELIDDSSWPAFMNDSSWPTFMDDCTHPKCQRFVEKQINLLTGEECSVLDDESSMFELLSTVGSPVLLRKHIDTCDSCKSARPDTSDEEPPSEVYVTSLGNAIRVKNWETAAYLLKFLPRRQINEPIERGRTLLYSVCESYSSSLPEESLEKRLKLVEELIALGASPNEGFYGEIYEYPLHLAIGLDDVALIEALCKGVEPSVLREMLMIRGGDNGWAALHYAIKWECERRDAETRLETLQALLKLAPKDEELLRLRDDDGKTPLDLARGVGDGDGDDEDDEDDEDDYEDEDIVVELERFAKSARHSK
ncbi:nacht and wd domain-containing protein [Cordyceps javanica]|uniref:Nacht and wd domain-containing protein n=1 Tax=Cordyceps javanica TaxID=43265 RepID=A0A545ULR8_9HYPO|nr:nacht and wd domain-containing protein [Cordyceps javanica]TQW01980.1 hypothetical protein IF2G_10551 [Cordyceps javanica]